MVTPRGSFDFATCGGHDERLRADRRARTTVGRAALDARVPARGDRPRDPDAFVLGRAAGTELVQRATVAGRGHRATEDGGARRGDGRGREVRLTQIRS